MTNSKEYELKDVLVCTRTSTVLVASELDDPLQAIANAEALWPEGQLAKSENETSSMSSYREYVNSDEDPTEPELMFPNQLNTTLPIQKGAIYQVQMIREYRRMKGQPRWKLISVDFTNAAKVGD